MRPVKTEQTRNLYEYPPSPLYEPPLHLVVKRKLEESFHSCNKISRQHGVQILPEADSGVRRQRLTVSGGVIPLLLTGGTFSVYIQLAKSDRKSAEKVKKVLLAAFAADPYMPYNQFVNRRLCTGELPDVYLADLWHLAALFGDG